ncbi:Hydrolase in pqqF 5'region [Geodia barretti]|jgi:predicted amidohydrolase|uniref:Hydrolase in pqqF 5'region n=1 Tax=Geodia barretti TaxID=519541 RepID=A0AA35SGB5_GEOBA|nr:Hydrolase in pqqF 5'region [Geodia barretti]
METNKHLFAFFQGAAEIANVSANLSKMETQLCKAAAVGAELLIFPELFLTGYHVPGEEMKRLAEERDGPSFRELSRTARESNIAVLYGYPEVDRSSGAPVYYNSAQLIDRDGTSLVNYRKTHLWIDEEGYEKVFRPGESFAEIAECCGVKIGVLICFDVEYPECVRTLALRGAQFVGVPTAIKYSMRTKIVPGSMIPCRARENGLYVAYVNSSGDFFGGHSISSDPNGDVLVQAGRDEQMALFFVDPNLKPSCDFMSMRKPSVYSCTCTQ